MINISPPPSEQPKHSSIKATFDLAFRPFFLSGALFSVIGLLLWNVALTSPTLSATMYGGSLFWHKHEMLLGFVPAIMVGFLLTAVQTWTRVPSLHGKPLMALMFIWLMGRVLMLLPTHVPLLVIAVVDSLFLPLSACALAYPIIKVKLWRNLFFIPILLLMAILNILMHFAVLTEQIQHIANLSHIIVLLITFVMCVMGGRVFPMFTANGTKTTKVEPIAWLEKIALGSVMFAIICGANLFPLPKELVAAVFILAGCAQFARAVRWRIWVTFKTPLVWSLHISYLSIALGLIALGLAKLELIFSYSQAIHILTVGGMGTMILSMISRVSLGHTGRMIVVGKLMTLALIAIVLSFVIRVFGSFIFADYLFVLKAATALWVFAYGAFFVFYLPILTTPRKL
ncbi:NnrS family protein [Thalassotalea aquiviva]|uniref:NnrS family protein n=1 Tax=Thalassotalea aquiviva TaxID=3242415 RepID=UPI00352B6304